MNATMTKPTSRAARKAEMLAAAIRANAAEYATSGEDYDGFTGRARILWTAACADRETNARTLALVTGRDPDVETKLESGMCVGGKSWREWRPLARAAWRLIVAGEWWTDEIRAAVRA